MHPFHKRIRLDPESKIRHSRVLNIKDLHNREELSDFVVKLRDGKEIKCHKIILATKSKFFKDGLLEGDHGFVVCSNLFSLVLRPYTKPM